MTVISLDDFRQRDHRSHNQTRIMHFDQWPDIIFPDWAVQQGFEDVSWSNDAAARAELKLKPVVHELHHLLVELTVSHEDKGMREALDWPRFTACVLQIDERGGQIQDGPCLSLYYGEDENDCRLIVLAFLMITNRRT